MLCLIEKGEANPSVQSLLGLAEALALPLASFFDERHDSKIKEDAASGSSSSFRRMNLSYSSPHSEYRHHPDAGCLGELPTGL